MVSSPGIRTEVNPYQGLEFTPRGKRPSSLDPWPKGNPPGQKTTSGNPQNAAVIDIKAESVTLVQTPSASPEALPVTNLSVSERQDEKDNFLPLEGLSSFSTLNYHPSKKKGGGIEFSYENPLAGRLVDLLA